MDFIKKNKKLILFLVILVLVVITLATRFNGSTDIGDYADVAKYFAGEYDADIRSSHSYLYGYLHWPFVALTDSLVSFKISSLLALLLIVYSVYFINGKDERTLWLMLLSPVVWYMAPWINPIQLSGLFLLWSWYFLRKFDSESKLKDLLISGLFVGLGWAVWDTILFFGAFLGLVFLWDKKFWNSLLFLVGVFVGLIPRLMLDQKIFGFAFYTIVKSFMGTLANIAGGIYERTAGHTALTLSALIFILLAIPIYYWKSYAPKNLKENKKTIIFLSLCLLLILSNPQVRYIIALAPIMVVLVAKEINGKQFRVSLIVSILVSLFFVAPYVAQALDDRPDISVLIEDIVEIHQNETFVVGNAVDDYATLARAYWGDEVVEFVSIQDYGAWESGNLVLLEKEWKPVPRIDERRQLFLSGGIQVNENDKTDYESIRYAIGINGPVELEGFEVVARAGALVVSEKK